MIVLFMCFEGFDGEIYYQDYNFLLMPFLLEDNLILRNGLLMILLWEGISCSEKSIAYHQTNRFEG